MFRTHLLRRPATAVVARVLATAPLVSPTSAAAAAAAWRRAPSHSTASPLPAPSAPARRLYATRGGGGGGDGEGGFEYDPMAGIRHDAAVETAKESVDDVIDSLVPENAPAAAREKVRAYLQQHPIDVLVVADQVQITHLEDSESGEEQKVNLSPCTREEALEQARERGINLVQMGAREGTAFCRLRSERPRITALIAEEMKSAAPVPGEEPEGGDGKQQRHHKPRPQIDHIFRDVVDAHFIGWKSKKIAEDIRRGHPVRLTIKDFQSAESAVMKMREMCLAIQKYGEEKKIPHQFTSIVAHDRECSITLTPVAAGGGKSVKHPGEKEWSHTLKRMAAACEKAGRVGTYAKSGRLKPRNVGATTYRVDKYGRRVD